MAEYRIYTLDGDRRIVRCQEALCTDDRHAFIVSTALGASAELEIWQSQRFVGRSMPPLAQGDSLRRSLTTTVGHRDGARRAAPGQTLAATRPDARARAPGRDAFPGFVAIGASGEEGLEDIADLLRALEKPVPAVVLVVLHRPPDRIGHLRQLLALCCDMPVAVACEGQRLVPGTCYVGEPDGHLTVAAHDPNHLVRGARDTPRDRTIDTLFTSLAARAGRRAVGIMLSGSLDDGSRGLAAIHAARGLTMVLDPGATPHGTRRAAVGRGGAVDLVGTAEEIAEALGRVFESA